MSADEDEFLESPENLLDAAGFSPEKNHDGFSTPTLKYYEMMYGKSVDGNDQKALGAFKMYEPVERFRRLQVELQAIKEGKVSDNTLQKLLGVKRKNRFQSFQHWAGNMLIWSQQAAKK